MSFKWSWLLIISALSYLPLQAQELDCRCTVVQRERANTDINRVADDMENSFAQFLNNRRWTNDYFKPEERIRCNLIISVNRMPSVGVWDMKVQIQSSRPVFNTSYETVVINFGDQDWQFNYNESQPLDFNENAFLSNLTSMLAFYAYIILAYDYDTFAKEGGKTFVDQAWNVVNYASQSDRKGWDRFENNRNRYWLAENLIQGQTGVVREAQYLYHRQGLDMFEEDPDKARENIVEALKILDKVQKERPNSIIVITFFDAKSDELVEIFREGQPSIRRQAYDLVTKLNPNRTEDYAPMIE